jgi:hypothetical protein
MLGRESLDDLGHQIQGRRVGGTLHGLSTDVRMPTQAIRCGPVRGRKVDQQPAHTPHMPLTLLGRPASPASGIHAEQSASSLLSGPSTTLVQSSQGG